MHAAIATEVFRHDAAIRIPAHALAADEPRPAETGAAREFAKDREIFAEGDAAACFYKMISGAVRTYKLLDDGRRQIDAFHLPGDFFGVESGEQHRFTAETVGPATVLAFRRCGLDSLAAADRRFARQLVAAMMLSLERAQEHMLLLGRKSAIEKVATFILDMRRRLSGDETVDLPMSRIDIADYLGLTIETVSRSLTELERRGVIEVAAHRRNIILRDAATLERLHA